MRVISNLINNVGLPQFEISSAETVMLARLFVALTRDINFVLHERKSSLTSYNMVRLQNPVVNLILPVYAAVRAKFSNTRFFFRFCSYEHG